MAHGTSINQGEQASFSPTKRTRSRSFHTSPTPDPSHLISPRPVIPSNSTKKQSFKSFQSFLWGISPLGLLRRPTPLSQPYSSFIYIVRKILRNPRPWPGDGRNPTGYTHLYAHDMLSTFPKYHMPTVEMHHVVLLLIPPVNHSPSVLAQTLPPLTTGFHKHHLD